LRPEAACHGSDRALAPWHRRFIAAKWDYSARRTRTGRPPTRTALKKLILQLAREKHSEGTG